MKILANYKALIPKIVSTPIAPINIQKNLPNIKNAEPIQPKSLLRIFKEISVAIKSVIFKPPKVYEEIPPLPPKVQNQKRRIFAKIELEPISEDRKVLAQYFASSKYATPKEEQKFNLLLTKKYSNGEYVFDCFLHLDELLKNKNLSPQTLKDLLDFTANSNRKFPYFDSGFINDDSIEIYKTLLTRENSYSSKPYDSWVSNILMSVNKDNKDELLKLINAKDATQNPRFSNKAIALLANYINAKNNRAVPFLLNAKKSDGSFKFVTKFDCSVFKDDWHVLKDINGGNLSAVPYLLEHKTKIGDKIKHTLSADEFVDIIRKITTENIKTVPLLMNELSVTKNKQKGFLTAEKVAQILENLKNGDEAVVPEILQIKDPIYTNRYLFDNRSNCKFVGEVAKAFSDKSLKSIAKKLLQEKPFTIYQDMPRYKSPEGIYEYSKMIKQNLYRKERKFLTSFHDADRIPRFTNMKEIVEISKDLAQAPNKEIIKNIITLKDPYSKEYVYSKYEHYNAIKSVDNLADIEKIKELLQVTNYSKTKSALSIKTIIEILNQYKKQKIVQLPIPKVLPYSDVNNDVVIKNLELLDKYRKNLLKFEELTSVEKLNLKSYINALSQYPLKENSKYKFNLEKLKDELNKHISQTITPTEIDKIHKIKLFQNVLSNNNNVENQIKTFDFKSFGKDGLPLEFSRKQFLDELKNLLSSASNTVKKNILNKLQIQTNSDFSSYEGVINLLNLNKANKLEKQVQELCQRFIIQNKVKTGDMQFDEFVNSLIKGMPEFINIIGKQPHSAHNYSIDIHSLEVLQNCLKNNEYNKLGYLDKTKLKFAVLMHDIAKKENVIDKEHQQLSALYARNILAKYNFPQFVKNDIYFIIQNHHWLEELTNDIKPIETLACNFRNPNDVLMSKIFTYADLKSVSPSIFNSFAKDLSGEKAEKLYRFIDNLKETGNILFTSRVVNKKKLPIEKFANHDYRVINLTKISPSQDLGEIGFVPGTKLKDLKFFVHTVKNAEALNIVKDLDDVSQDGVLSLSYISAKQNASYYNNKFGVILDENIPDIINASPDNQGSGYAKNKDRLISLKTSSWNKDSKEFLPKIVRKKLGLNATEYKSLYEQISTKKYFSQVQDDNIFKLSSGKSIDGRSIKNAINESQEQLLTQNKHSHNEVVGSYLQTVGFFAKVNSIKEIPQQYLDFVKENDIPIYLFGKN